jgi:hypothetical protein
MPETLERIDLPDEFDARARDSATLDTSEEGSWVPPAPPEGLDTLLYEHDELAARADLRRQIAVLEAALGRLFGSAFPRTGIEYAVAAPGGPRILPVDELERVRDGLAARVQDVKARIADHTQIEERNRQLIEEMTADPEAHKWIRVSNEDIGEPGCRHWHSRPRWGLLGMLKGWWRVRVSSGCPLAKGLRPPDGNQAAAAEAAAAGRRGFGRIRASESSRSGSRGGGRCDSVCTSH